MTIAVTCALSALPLPVTAALTSLGVWKCTSMPRLAAASAITPPACAVPITVDDVLLGEHPLDRDDVGAVGVHPVFDGVADGEQPVLQWLVGRGADHVDVQRDDLAALTALDDGQPAARQPGIDSHYPHVSPFCEHLFESLTGGSDAFGHDTRCQRDAAVPRSQRPARGQQRFGAAQRAGQNERALQRADQRERHLAGLLTHRVPARRSRRLPPSTQPWNTEAEVSRSSSTVSATSAATLATGHMFANPVPAMSSAAWVKTPSIASPRSVYSSTIDGMSSA